MHQLFLLPGLAAACLSLPLLVAAAPMPPASGSAADPAAPVPPPRHCSVLRPAAAASEPERRDWRVANQATSEAGGWRAYAKEAARTPVQAPRPCESGAGR